MLDPRDRSLLLECLRPPDGCRLDFAVGTSFSLDLIALLTTPLAFTFFDWEDEGGSITADPLALLGAVRRHAERITIFCQAGQIVLPPVAQRLTAYLEKSVVEVAAPKGGVFHPKIWVLRFIGPDESVSVRLVCLSRNLTFDRSWDAVLVLDGAVVDRQRAFGENHPLGEFIEALPTLAVKAVPQEVKERARILAAEVRRVQWTYPEGIDAVNFWPIGLSGRRQWPFGGDIAGRPIMIMSPFVRDRALERLTDAVEKAVLISRPDELARLSPETLSRFQAVFAFDPQDEPAQEDLPADGGSASLSGLHAKTYVVDDGWNARVFIGSANATNGAFNSNVEFLTELRGRKKELGIDALLSTSDDGQVGLRELLTPWVAGSKVPDQGVLLREKMEKELDGIRCGIGAIPLIVAVEADADDKFRMTLSSLMPVPDLRDAKLTCWPTTLRSDHALALLPGEKVAAKYSGVTLDAITGFMAFELSLSRDGQAVTRRFACSATVIGAPADRLDRLLASMLGDREQLLRFLWLLLETQAGIDGGLGSPGNQFGSPWGAGQLDGYPVFERIVKTLAGDRHRLNDIGRLIDDLSRTPQGQDLLPVGLIHMWGAIRKLKFEGAR